MVLETPGSQATSGNTFEVWINHLTIEKKMSKKDNKMVFSGDFVFACNKMFFLSDFRSSE